MGRMNFKTGSKFDGGMTMPRCASNLCYLLLAQFVHPVALSSIVGGCFQDAPFACIHVFQVLRLRFVLQVIRIPARRIVATMGHIVLRWMAVMKLKRNSMSKFTNALSLHERLHNAVPRSLFTVWPNPASFGIRTGLRVFTEKLYEFRVDHDRSILSAVVGDFV